MKVDKIVHKEMLLEILKSIQVPGTMVKEAAALIESVENAEVETKPIDAVGDQYVPA